MSDTLKMLDEQISEKEQELSDLKAARRVIAKMEGSESTLGDFSKRVIPNGAGPLTPSGKIDFDKLKLPEKAVSNKPSIIDLAREVIGKFDGNEFTVNHVYAAMVQLGYIHESKHVRNRVSLAVRKFADEGMLVRTHKGKGNDPHKYKIKGEQVSFLDKVSNG